MIYECKLLANRYLEFQEQYWDTRMLFLQNFKSVRELNEAVDVNIDQLKADPKCKAGWLPALGIHLNNWEKFDEQWQVILQPKVYLFIYDSAWNTNKYWISAHVFRDVNFICVPKSGQTNDQWVVYTQLDGNNLNYRFKQVTKAVVDQAIADAAAPPETPVTPGTPSTPSVPDQIITDNFNMTITANNLTITIQTKGENQP